MAQLSYHTHANHSPSSQFQIWGLESGRENTAQWSHKTTFVLFKKEKLPPLESSQPSKLDK